MALLDLLLGRDNPFAAFVDQNRNTIHNAGAGFAQGTSFGGALSNAAQGAAQGAPFDDAYAITQKADKERLDGIAKTAQYLKSNPAFADLVPLAEAGQSAAALNEAFRRSAALQKAAPEPFTLNPGDTRFAGDGSVMATVPALPEKPAAPPSGYRVAADGKSFEFVPGGPADPATASKTTEATRRNQQLAKVIVPEVQSLLGDGTQANPGTFDELSSWGAQASDAMGPLGLVLTGGPDAKYQQAKNSLKTIIASYLYSVSGATANPGEVDTQASVLTPRPGEPAASVAAKKQRVATMVQAVVDAAKGTPIQVDDSSLPTGQPLTPGPSGKQWNYNPATGKLE
jgi:hypothetical protein